MTRAERRVGGIAGSLIVSRSCIDQPVRPPRRNQENSSLFVCVFHAQPPLPRRVPLRCPSSPSPPRPTEPIPFVLSQTLRVPASTHIAVSECSTCADAREGIEEIKYTVLVLVFVDGGSRLQRRAFAFFCALDSLDYFPRKF